MVSVNAVICQYKIDRKSIYAHSWDRCHERFFDKAFAVFRNTNYKEFVLHEQQQISALPPADLWVFYASDKPRDIVETLGLEEGSYLFLVPDEDS
jgi:hypothetical protein